MDGEEELGTGGKDATLAVIGGSGSGRFREQKQTFSPEDAEFQSYSELLEEWLEKFIRWKEILQQEKYRYNDEFDVVRSLIGSSNKLIPHNLRPFDKVPRRILHVRKRNELDIPEHGLYEDTFMIKPGLAGKHLLVDPEDDTPLKEITITVGIQSHVPVKKIEIRTERPNINREGYSAYRSAYYRIGRNTLQVGRNLMTDEMATSLLNTIDALIPSSTSLTPQPERRANQKTRTPNPLPQSRRRRPAGR